MSETKSGQLPPMPSSSSIFLTRIKIRRDCKLYRVYQIVQGGSPLKLLNCIYSKSLPILSYKLVGRLLRNK